MDEGAASRNGNDVLMLRAQLKSLVEHTVITNKVALETEKVRDELYNQIEQIEQRLHPKRAHSHVILVMLMKSWQKLKTGT